MTDWSIDLTASLAVQEDELRARALSSVKLQPEGSPGPDSSTASELDDFEMSYLHEMFQADALLAPGDDAILLDQSAPAGKRSQPGSARQQSMLEESWVHTLNADVDDSAASTHTTCSPDGSDALELCGEALDEPAGAHAAKAAVLAASAFVASAASAASTPPAMDSAGQKRKADVEFPPVGAAKLTGAATAGAGVAAAVAPGPEAAWSDWKELEAAGSDANPAAAMPGCVIAPSGVVIPSPMFAANHRFTDAELQKLDMETTRANDIVAALMARDPATLSVEEVKLLKKHKRLIKNRESAQAQTLKSQLYSAFLRCIY